MAHHHRWFGGSNDRGGAAHGLRRSGRARCQYSTSLPDLYFEGRDTGPAFTATIWCGRLYKALRHQSAINKHRANALRTFQTFTMAASDDETHNAVLMETTKSIFLLIPSGYLDNESTSGNGLTVVEVVQHPTRAATAHRASTSVLHV